MRETGIVKETCSTPSEVTDKKKTKVKIEIVYMYYKSLSLLFVCVSNREKEIGESIQKKERENEVQCVHFHCHD